jgi:glyoxylase-like metal-dependent hydrolase (beta-lactamase superfamily II)
MVERVIVGAWKTNCYIYSSTKKECIIIDPGGDETEIAARVDVLNMVPVGIALTHGHVDHVGALGRLREGYAIRGYKLPIAINPADRRFLGTGGMETHRESLETLGLDEESFFGGDPSELPKADVRLKDGDHLFNMDIMVLETPGHTPGSVCFYAEKEGILFSGDTLFFDGVGRTDLPGGSEKKLKESIQRKIAVLPPETRVFPGHGPFTTVEREKRGNVFFRETVQEQRPEPGARTIPGLASLRVTQPAVPVKTVRPVVKAALKAAPKRAKPARAPAKTVRTAKKSASKTVKSAAKSGRLKSRGLKPKPVAARKSSSRAAGGRKKPVQARRSTKAPGSGKKRAR